MCIRINQYPVSQELSQNANKLRGKGSGGELRWDKPSGYSNILFLSLSLLKKKKKNHEHSCGCGETCTRLVCESFPEIVPIRHIHFYWESCVASVLCHQLLNCFVIFMWYHSCFYNSPWCWKKWMHWLLCPARNRRTRNNSPAVLLRVDHWNEMLAGHRTVSGGAFISGFPWYCTSAVNWEVFSAQKTVLPGDAVKPCRVLISAELRGTGLAEMGFLTCPPGRVAHPAVPPAYTQVFTGSLNAAAWVTASNPQYHAENGIVSTEGCCAVLMRSLWHRKVWWSMPQVFLKKRSWMKT